MLKNTFIKLVNWLLPPTCLLCGDPSHQDHDICLPCQQELPWLKQVCPQCALPLPATTAPEQACGNCLLNPPSYSKTIALWSYEKPVDHLITALKFNHQLVYARLLGELLAKQLYAHYQNQPLPTYVIPVPLHNRRLRERGFNQALEIARPIAKKLRIPIASHHCQRILATAPQTLLPATERHNNVKNAFTITHALQAKHIAIIDDVITTGHTITELSQQWHQAGVEQIDVWCCARTQSYNKFAEKAGGA